jgi:mannose-6-phosphate isomerase-like protein (cupin superfamily)
MRRTLITLALLGITAFAADAPAPPPATDLKDADIQAFLKALPRDKVSDLPIRVVDVGGYKVGIFGVFRPKSALSEANIHETTTTEVYQMLEGSATLVTGGAMKDPRKVGNSLRGSGIEGGVSRHVAKGDVIIIPGRLPHWFSHLDTDLTYLITRPNPDGAMTLK